jgi:hypothetical protein
MVPCVHSTQVAFTSQRSDGQLNPAHHPPAAKGRPARGEAGATAADATAGASMIYSLNFANKSSSPNQPKPRPPKRRARASREPSAPSTCKPQYSTMAHVAPAVSHMVAKNRQLLKQSQTGMLLLAATLGSLLGPPSRLSTLHTFTPRERRS